MPTSIPSVPVATSDNYTAACTLGPIQLLDSVQFVIAGASVLVQTAKNNRDGRPIWDTNEVTFAAGSWGFNGIQGIRFRSAIAGNPATITQCNGFYGDDAVPFSTSSAQTSATDIVTLDPTQTLYSIPAGATFLTVICLGGGGGGANGVRSGTTATGARGGGGGGGGALSIVTHSVARLLAQFPGGIPYAVGLGGAAANPGGQSTFAGQKAGGGAAGLVSAVGGGGGGGVNSGLLAVGGIPSGAGGTRGTGIQGMGGGSGSAAGGGEYGGGGGGSSQQGTSGAGQQAPGWAGGPSLWGGGGGGGGGGYTNNAIQAGGAGGLTNSYPAILPAQVADTGGSGLFAGEYAGNGGAGGNSALTGGAAASGAAGGPGAGGGGGGGSGSGALGAGGKGGDGAIYVFVS